jgi:hypothetical protein
LANTPAAVCSPNNLRPHLALVINDVGHRQRFTARDIKNRSGFCASTVNLMPSFSLALLSSSPCTLSKLTPNTLTGWPLQLLGQGVELGDFDAARATPFGPVIDHLPLFVDALGRDFLAVLVNAIIIAAAAEQECGDNCQCAYQSRVTWGNPLKQK